jgi:hypothetical protein
MPELHNRLTTDARAWQQALGKLPTSADVLPMTAPRRSVARAWLAPMTVAAVLIAAVVTATLSIAGGRGSTSRSVPAASPTTSAPPAAAPRYLGPVTSTSGAATNALQLPPPGEATPKLGWLEAYASMCAQGARCDLAGSASVVLAFVTTPGQGKVRPDGSVVPTVQHELSYVVTWTGLLDCPPLGHAMVQWPTPSMEPTRTRRTCVDTRVVDANTGTPIGYEYFNW